MFSGHQFTLLSTSDCIDTVIASILGVMLKKSSSSLFKIHNLILKLWIYNFGIQEIAIMTEYLLGRNIPITEVELIQFDGW